MNRSTVGVAVVAALALAGCGPSLPEQRNQAIGEFQVGRLDAAQGQFEQIVQRHPGDTQSLYHLGRIHHARGQYGWAIHYYQCALTAAPFNHDAQQWLARAQREAGPIGEDLRYLPHATPPTAPQP